MVEQGRVQRHRRAPIFEGIRPVRIWAPDGPGLIAASL
ncbi:antitoxin MazE-like protein [Dactylosporangium sp. CA-139114]